MWIAKFDRIIAFAVDIERIGTKVRLMKYKFGISYDQSKTAATY